MCCHAMGETCLSSVTPSVSPAASLCANNPRVVLASHQTGGRAHTAVACTPSSPRRALPLWPIGPEAPQVALEIAGAVAPLRAVQGVVGNSRFPDPASAGPNCHGLYTSALATTPLVPTPPVTSTVPFGSSVAVGFRRAICSGAVSAHV